MVETPETNLEFVDETPAELVEDFENMTEAEEDTDPFSEVKNFWTSNMRTSEV